MKRLKVAWIIIKLNLRWKPKGQAYKGIVYFNRAAVKSFKRGD